MEQHITTVSEVSKKLGISNRMLRYYEQVGLIQSQRIEEYAYRVYDEEAVKRLRRIIILRKLRVPVKQILTIMRSDDAAAVIDIFTQNINGLEDEITALSTIRDILTQLVDGLRETAQVQMKLDWLENNAIVALTDAIAFSKNTIQEGITMSELNQAEAKLDEVQGRRIRVVWLPPATVAAVQCIGNQPELRSGDFVRELEQKTKLPTVLPGFRHYGFNSPNGTNDDDHGYERWLTIPDDWEVEPPFVKKHFSGGLFAACPITMGEWDQWHHLWKWVENSTQYAFNLDPAAGMDGMIEEHFNMYNHYGLKDFDPDTVQMDLMIPVKVK